MAKVLQSVIPIVEQSVSANLLLIGLKADMCIFVFVMHLLLFL